jgi:hypothetical protein
MTRNRDNSHDKYNNPRKSAHNCARQTIILVLSILTLILAPQRQDHCAAAAYLPKKQKSVEKPKPISIKSTTYAP